MFVKEKFASVIRLCLDEILNSNYAPKFFAFSNLYLGFFLPKNQLNQIFFESII